MMSEDNKQSIRQGWIEVLKRKNCIEIYEYLYNVILNEDYSLDRKLVVELLKMGCESDLPCEPGPYGNLKIDIEHYVEVYSKKST